MYEDPWRNISTVKSCQHSYLWWQQRTYTRKTGMVRCYIGTNANAAVRCRNGMSVTSRVMPAMCCRRTARAVACPTYNALLICGGARHRHSPVRLIRAVPPAPLYARPIVRTSVTQPKISSAIGTTRHGTLPCHDNAVHKTIQARHRHRSRHVTNQCKRAECPQTNAVVHQALRVRRRSTTVATQTNVPVPGNR